MRMTPGVSRTAFWAGWVLSALPMPLLIMSAAMKFAANAQVAEGFAHLGWPMSAAVALGVTELACVALYLVPRTAVLGAVLLTGYMGGAMATHARIGEMFVVQAVLPIVAWLGLYLRDPRLRALLPLRKAPAA